MKTNMFKKFFNGVAEFGKSIPSKIKKIPSFIKDIPSKVKYAWAFVKALVVVTIPDMIKSVFHSIAALIGTPTMAK